ncbi:hypothetical protein RJ639_036988 [Escallonia herrerae]|uniref:Dicer-like protein 4 n=1 Tax=Escallonia herrerae TaxID=1293975 RepID=A0AA89BIN7_9ASTE|nr:hypothetical protein RJ639_036988 [Escallonia herrerae]
MDGGGATTIGDVADFCAVSEQFSSILVSDGRESGVGAPRPVKDPTKVARNYQMELCRKALKENIIVYLETGSGKTHIAVCLIYEMSHLIKKPEKNLCVFLAPTVALVEQQARVIQDSIDFKVGTYCGNSKRLKDHRDWEKEMEEHEVLVMTPQILLHNLSHCFIRIELITLLIFDECHYAQLESNHPYAEIMKVFYKPDVNKLPRVFGMTASPKFGKGASISNLETLLHAKVYSVEDKEEVEKFLNSPKLRVYYYENSADSTSCSNENYFMKLERIKHQCVSALSRKTDDHSSLYSIKKILQRLHGNMIFCLENLGVWGALQFCCCQSKATRVLLKSDYFERNELVEAEGQCSADSLCDKYLAQLASVLASDCMKDDSEADLSSVEILREPFFSRKLIKLIGILLSFSGNQKELNLVGNLTKDEDQMNKEIASRKASVTFVDFEERTYKVDSTGATISSGSSVSLLYHYCSKLPRDEFFTPKPQFFYFDETEGSVCHIILPANAPIHQIVSAPQLSIEAAKKDGCLKACSELHNLGALTDYLLPDHDLVEEPMQDFSDSESLDDEDSRRELHEMLVPAILKGPWEKQENTVCLSSYFAKFSPHPVDRSYKEFGIFLKQPLPGEAERMKLYLRLARGRSVMTELVPYGFAKFDEEEIILAEKFQEMCLKIILDRSELIGEHVSLGKSDCINSSSPTFYLMLPVIRHTYKNSMTIDWKLVRRCLSSSIFRTSKDAGENAILDPKSNLHLANGLKSKEDVVGSLVYAPCKNTFFFVSEVVLDKNGYSTAKESINHVDHYVDVRPNNSKVSGHVHFLVISKFNAVSSTMHLTLAGVLEALTTEKCNEHFSLERLEVLGDAFLKFAVGRQLFLLHDALDEGLLTRKRSNLIYIRDQSFEPCLFFALGRPCPVICSKGTETSIHSSHEGNDVNGSNAEVRCSSSHRWLHKKSISDVVEALVGAFIVDSGFKATTAFLKWIGINVDFQASQVNNICSASTIFMSLADRIDIAALESNLGYQFLHKGLLVQAFLHPSYNKHAGGCYQRLEFLGDAVLDYLITSYLYSVYPKLKPGQLTDLRSVSVNNKSFADIAVHRSFQEFIICDSSSLCESISKYVNFVRASELQKGLVEAPCPKALGDLVESSIGAIFLDTGFNLNRVWNIMLSFLTPITSFSKLQLNPTRELRELCQSHNWNVQFPAIKKDRLFAIEAKVSGNGVSETACATNLNRKTAKNMAAKQLCSKLKAQGYKARSKALEEVLRSSQKMEAKLIGYDEKPTDVLASYPIGFETLAVHEPSRSNGHLKVHPISVEPKKVSKPNVGPVRQPPSSSNCQFTENIESNGCSVDSQTPGGSSKGSSKSRLYEICAANCWKPPLFDCCMEAGPSHLKEFIFKVSMEIEENTNMVLECIGDPRAKKKDAAEHAAEGALWYLKHEGYLEDKDRD